MVGKRIICVAFFITVVSLLIVYRQADIQYRQVKAYFYNAQRDEHERHIRLEKNWIIKNQGLSGEIYVNSQTEGGAKDVNPYFACQAALGLLTQPVMQQDLDAVMRYLQWHTRELIENKGIVCNYRYSESKQCLISTGEYDSVDSYLALYLEVLAKYAKVTGDLSSVGDWKTAIDISLDCLEELMADGLCRIKPDSERIYLMDNLEVLNSLRELQQLLPKDERISKMIELLQQSIVLKLWNDDERHFEIGISNAEGKLFKYDGIRKFYPDALVQLYPIYYSLSGVDDKCLKALYNEFCDAYSWEEEHIPDSSFEWPILASIALIMDDIERAESYYTRYYLEYGMDDSRDYPFYVGVSGMEIVMEERYLNYIAGRSETSLLHDMIMRGIW